MGLLDGFDCGAGVGLLDGVDCGSTDCGAGVGIDCGVGVGFRDGSDCGTIDGGAVDCGAGVGFRDGIDSGAGVDRGDGADSGAFELVAMTSAGFPEPGSVKQGPQKSIPPKRCSSPSSVVHMDLACPPV